MQGMYRRKMGVLTDIKNDLNQSALQLMLECRDRLYSVAFRECGNVADAEDLVSRTFAKAIQKLDCGMEVANLYGWLKTMMLNLRADDQRKAVVRGTYPADPAELELCAGADWSTDEQIVKDSDSEAIRQALDELDPKYRRAMLMRYYDDFSLKEIADILRLPMGTVSRRIQIAHRLLAGKLSGKLGKKPLAMLLAALLGVGALFGAWVSPLGDWVAEKVFGSAPAEETTVESIQAVEPTPDVASDIEGPDDQDRPDDVISETQNHESEDNMNISANIKKTVAVAAAALTMSLAAQAEETPAEVQAQLWFHNRTKIMTPQSVTDYGLLETEPLRMIDGVQEANIGFYFSDNYPEQCVFDLGSHKTLTSLQVCPARPTDYWKGRAGITFSISDDAVTWEVVASIAKYDSTGYQRIDLSGFSAKKYRYVKVAGTSGGCGEIKVFTSELAISLDPVRTANGGDAPMAEECADGVLFSGSVERPVSAPVTVRAYIADADYDEDIAAWQARGREVPLAELEGNGAYSVRVKDLPEGSFFVRTVAICGGETAVSQMTRAFASKAKPQKELTVYMNILDSTLSGRGAESFFNAGTGLYQENQSTTFTDGRECLVFDLKSIIESKRYVSALRIWPCGNNVAWYCRSVSACAYLAYDNETPVVWKSSGSIDFTKPKIGAKHTTSSWTSTSRTVDCVSAEDWPSLTWTAGPVAQLLEYGNAPYRDNRPWEMTIDPAVVKDAVKQYHKTGVMPRYLKVTNVYGLSLGEVELRTSPIPKRKGLAILFF